MASSKIHNTLHGYTSLVPQKPGTKRNTLPSTQALTGVEFECVYELGPPQLLDDTWPAVELWTTNRVYTFDAQLQCIQVHEYGGPPLKDNAMLGARLVGGQQRSTKGAIVRVSQPYPLEGMNAILAKTVGRRKAVSETSPIKRVIARSRVVELEP